ncbi:ATP-binding protein [Streptomyces chartreusis]|uniref:ATP-binding protein n=1 Tax=Streptomyces chartreusis TaxID=1969 RepID=UPI00399A0FD7
MPTITNASGGRTTRTRTAPRRRVLAGRASAVSWSHLEYLVACLQREASPRDSHGGEQRIRQAHFPAIKTIEELDLADLQGMARQQLTHLGTPGLHLSEENAVFLGPQGTCRTHVATGLASLPGRASRRFATSAQGVDRLQTAGRTGQIRPIPA